MHITRIAVGGFRNYRELVLEDLGPKVVFVGENNVGKSNLLQAIRLVLDPSLPDSARQLRADDFWDGERPFGGRVITVEVDLGGFAGDVDAQAVLSDYLVVAPQPTARLRYIYGPRPGAVAPPVELTEKDYQFRVVGGHGDRPLSGDLRRFVSLRVLPALRDAEGDLAVWSRSPLRLLLDRLQVPDAKLEEVALAIESATSVLLGDPSLADLDARIRQAVLDLAGRLFAIETSLGVASSRTA